MIEKLKKHQQPLLVVLTVIFMGLIMVGGIQYVKSLRLDLQENAVQTLLTVTVQQQQAFDTFIAEDRERLHGYADFFTQNRVESPEEVQRMLTLSNEKDVAYLVMCLDDGWVCSSTFDDIRQLDQENLGYFSSLPSSGVRDSYLGLYSKTPRFGYYETFTFPNGHRGLIQKSYDRSEAFHKFSLSFYNDQGLTYVLNQDGNILLRSAVVSKAYPYESMLDLLAENGVTAKKVDAFAGLLRSQEPGSITVQRDEGDFIYTCVPAKSVDGWCLVSAVPLNTISSETNRVFLNFQMVLGLLILLLFTCTMFFLLIWRTQRDLLAKDKEIEYQEQFLDLFASYLSSNTNDVYIMMDHETERVEYVSPNAERVLGVKPEKLIGYMRTTDMETDPKEATAYYAEARALSPGKRTEPRLARRMNPMTGEYRYFLENAYCAVIQGGTRRVLYISDRTRERASHDSLVEALQMAQAANEAKSAFLSSVSHDIRTPMNAIIGFLALMRSEVNNPETMLEYTQRIEAASQHLLGLINDVLDMNKIESGGTTLNISELNLAEVIEEINTIIRPQARAKNQTFDIFVPHLEYEHLLGDKLRMNQILINLLSNSVKYTPENGAIRLRVEELPQVLDNYSRIRLTVSDNGLGMSEDYLKVIFDPFTREETKRTYGIQGTGLGMAITKSLVDLMGGTIRVESRMNEGSTFTVELELRIQKQEEPEENTRFWNDYSVSRMIVADDDEEVCRSIVRAMAKTGVVTDYATNGEAAVQMMRTAREAGNPYDLVLLDWMMPTLNGLETARLIRKEYSKKIPILLITAYDWSEIEQEAMEIGVNHFMPKPFFMSTFKDAIRRVMGHQEKPEDSPTSDVVRGKRVLVVDDIEVNRMILVKILSALGGECDTAGNGQEAVRKFEASQPGEYDLILMDVQMPVMDGYTATRTIRSGSHPMARTIPIIAMTANAFVDDVRDAIESGMDAHIAKPVQIDNLKSTIQQVLNGRQEKAGKGEMFL